MATYTLYHNPRCSKSRQTLALLEERNITPHIVAYLEDPPSADVIRTLLKLLDRSPRELMRTKEDVYRSRGLADEQDDAKLIAAMVEDPILIERPILVREDDGAERAVIGRPPENALALIDS